MSGEGARMAFYVYMLASRRDGTLYIGMTDDIENRIWEHKEKIFKGFTSKYGVDQLVWYEDYETREVAFDRERAMKKWNRAWKIELIEKENPTWKDLYLNLNH
jgi:putative endonuclease